MRQTAEQPRPSESPGSTPSRSPGVEPADEVLMQRYQNGELGAFETLVLRHRKGVFHFILRFIGNPTQAEDLLQDVFVRLVAHAGSFERRSRFSTWLYTIARNLCIDFLRKARYRKTTSLDSPLLDEEGGERNLHETVRGSEPHPDVLAQNEELHGHLVKALAGLPAEQREVLLLREEAGLPFDEIAEIVQAPLNTVKSRMRYALHNLRMRLEAQGVKA